MIIDTNAMISITEANQNFSKVTKIVDELGNAVILKNNTPRYLVIDGNTAQLADRPAEYAFMDTASAQSGSHIHGICAAAVYTYL